AAADGAVEVGAGAGAARGVAAGGEGLQVVETGQAGGAANQLRGAGGGHHRRVGAEADAVCADAVRVGVALVDRPAHALDQVVLDACAPLLVAGLLEGVAAPQAAAVVDLQHQVAAAGEELGVGVEAPAVALHV